MPKNFIRKLPVGVGWPAFPQVQFWKTFGCISYKDLKAKKTLKFATLFLYIVTMEKNLGLIILEQITEFFV